MNQLNFHATSLIIKIHRKSRTVKELLIWNIGTLYDFYFLFIGTDRDKWHIPHYDFYTPDIHPGLWYCILIPDYWDIDF